MQYIYIDESGDLGFDFTKKGTSRYFVVAAIIVEDKDILEKIIRKTFISLSQKDRRRHSGTFHAFKEKEKTLRKILRLLKAESSIKIAFICLEKKDKDSEKSKYEIYNESVLRLVRNAFYDSSLEITLFSSQRETNKYINKQFKSFLSRGLGKKSRVKIINPSDEKGLQLVDIISWSIFRKYEFGDDFYYKLFEDKIIKKIEI